MKRGSALVLVAVAAVTCVDGPGASVGSLPPGDLEGFVRDVQPVLEARCANPSCHGSAERPLEVYAVQRHRADPARHLVSEPLSDEELVHNHLRAASFADSCDELPALVAKALASHGVTHVGGAVFEDPADREARALLEWARRAAGCAP